MTCTLARPVLIVIAAAVFTASVAAQDNRDTVSSITDERVLSTVCAPLRPVMPKGLFSPDIIRRIREDGPGIRQFFGCLRDPAAGARWLQVPKDHWRAVIAPHAPLTSTRCGGICPYCGKRLGRIECDIVDSPFTGRTTCCGSPVYGREEDIPDGFPARPNHTERVPHLDGSRAAYRFYIPPGAGDDPRRWFCPAAELWHARLHTLIYTVIPELTARLILLDDEKAVVSLGVIYDRLAEVYPAMPYYDLGRPVGFARARDLVPENASDDLLTAAVWDAEMARRERQPATFSTWDTACFKLHYPYGYKSDGDLIPHGLLAEGYAAIRQHDAFRQLSRDLYGDDRALERHIAENLFHRVSLYLRWKQPTLINMMSVYFSNAIKVAVVAQDQAFCEKIALLYDGFIYNHHVEDGLSTEGSFDYSAMMGWYLANPWIAREFLGIDFEARYPFVQRIRQLGDFPVRTLLQVESMHGDEHGAFFTTLHGRPPETLDYKAHAVSQHFPQYGLTCLRAGDTGKRLEAILDYQNQIMHGHAGRLNLQLFYEGVNLLPDIGYGTGNADVNRSPWNRLQTPLPIVPAPGVANCIESHCTAAIDGRQFDRWTFVPKHHIGGRDRAHPTALLQFVDVDGTPTYAHHPQPVMAFGRQLLTVDTGEGPVLIDIFRLSGGRRHDVFWHLPADTPRTNCGPPLKLSTRDLYEWYEQKAVPPPGWRKETEYIFDYVVNIRKQPFREELRAFTSPVAWHEIPDLWQAEWTIDPARYAPVTEKGREAYTPWKPFLTRTNLRLWGTVMGSPAKRTSLLGAHLPWASNAELKTRRGASRIGFKDGFNVLVEHRQGTTPGLESTFVHVLEPYKPAAGPVLSAVDIPTGTMQHDVTVNLTDAGGREVLVAANTHRNTRSLPDLELTGRLAAAWPGTANLVLYDGSRAATPDITVELEDSWNLSLLGVRGDLTGYPAESAILVQSARPLPTGTVLAGHPIVVDHQTSAAHASMYLIERISAESSGRYRIDLRHRPPFIQQKFHVVALDDEDPSWIMTNMRLFAGVQRPHGIGRRIRFPRSGFETVVQGHRAQGYAGWWARWFRLDEPIPEDRVAIGDPMLVYTIAPGDTVHIASHFACRETTDKEGTALDMFSTGNATIHLSETYRLRQPLSENVRIDVTPGKGARLGIRAGRTRIAVNRAEPE